MKKQFRILAAALALCLSLLCCPAAFAAVDSSSCQTVPYAQATSQPLGQPITITGTPNYSAATSNDTAFIFGFDTRSHYQEMQIRTGHPKESGIPFLPRRKAFDNPE